MNVYSGCFAFNHLAVASAFPSGTTIANKKKIILIQVYEDSVTPLA